MAWTHTCVANNFNAQLRRLYRKCSFATISKRLISCQRNNILALLTVLDGFQENCSYYGPYVFFAATNLPLKLSLNRVHAVIILLLQSFTTYMWTDALKYWSLLHPRRNVFGRKFNGIWVDMNVYSHIITSFSSADQFWRWAPSSCNHLKQVFSVPLAFITTTIWIKESRVGRSGNLYF